MMSSVFSVHDGDEMRDYKGFTLLNNINKQLDGNSRIALVQIDDCPELWLVDDSFDAVKELKRYYKEGYQRDVSVHVFQICRYVP